MPLDSLAGVVVDGRALIKVYPHQSRASQTTRYLYIAVISDPSTIVSRSIQTSVIDFLVNPQCM